MTSGGETAGSVGWWSDGRPPADRAIVMLGCIGAALTLLTVTVIAATTGTESFWLIVGPIGAGLFALTACRAYQLVLRHGYFHEAGEEEDDDGNPEGGSGVRFPPDAPDGGGSLVFDWDAFVTGFWDHVDATSREPVLS